MNDIERQIEGEFEEEKKEVSVEDNSFKSKFNYNKSDGNNKKIILYITIGLFIIVLLVVFIYLIFIKKDNNIIDDNDNTVLDDNTVIDNMDNNLGEDNIAYVTCDDNTALLNVRNSPTGDIIDGLSCYKEIVIEEELEGTDNCFKWYKISYKKRGSSYTGYSCATYIKKNETSKNTSDLIENLVDKANDYYENNYLKAYCGSNNNNNNEKKEIEFNEDGNIITGEYIKSEYNSLDELENYLLSFMDKDLLTSKLKLSDIKNPKYYDDYYEIDGNLYCRNYSSKGWMKFYTDSYDYEVVSVSDNKIEVNIAYEYLNESTIDDDKCSLKNLSSCTNSKFNYELGQVIIENVDSNYIITEMDFHK